MYSRSIIEDVQGISFEVVKEFVKRGRNKCPKTFQLHNCDRNMLKFHAQKLYFQHISTLSFITSKIMLQVSSILLILCTYVRYTIITS